MKYILCNSVFLGGQVLRVAKEIDDEKFDIQEILNEGGVLVALPNAILEARAVRIREQQAAGRWDDESVAMLATHAEEGGGGGGVPTSRTISAGPGLSGGGDLSADRIISLAFDDTAHGDRGGGSLHDVVTQTTNGFMSFLDKIKLDNTPAGASLIYRPGGVSGVGVVTTWAEVEAFANAQETPWVLFPDPSISPCEVPPGANTNLRNICTINTYPGATSGLIVKDTGKLRNVRMGLGGQVACEAITVAGVELDILSAVYDMQNGGNITNIPGVSLVAAIDVTVPSCVIASVNAGNIISQVPGVPMINYLVPGGFYIVAALSNSSGSPSNFSDDSLVADATSTLFSIGDTTTRLGPQSLFLGTILNSQIGTSNNLAWSNGSTASRPAYAQAGHQFFDTDLLKSIVFNGTSWNTHELQFKLIFEDGGTPAPGVVTTWADVILFAGTQTRDWELYFSGACVIPAGSYVNFQSLAMLKGLPGATVTIQDTGVIENPKGFDNGLFVSAEAVTAPAIILSSTSTMYLSGLSFIESAAGSAVPVFSVPVQYAVIEISGGSYVYTSGFGTIFDFPTASGDHYFTFRDHYQPGSNSPVPDNCITADVSSSVSCIHDGTAAMGAQAGVTGGVVNFPVDKAGFISYTPANAGHWVAPPPANIADALDRIAAVVSAGGGTPIP